MRDVPPPVTPADVSPVPALLRRPWLWPAAVVAGVRHLPRRWRRPGSAGPWLRFRLETAYGDERSTPTGDDLVTWLSWTRTRRRPR